MKKFLLVALTATQFLIPSAEAKKRSLDITVMAPPTVKVWAKNISQRLDNTMKYPDELLVSDSLRGFVRVQFSMSSNGSINGMHLVKRSGSRLLDNAALKAVSKIDRISVMPTSIGPGRVIEAHLLFARNEEQMRGVVAANKAYGKTPSNQLTSAIDNPLLLASLAMTPNSIVK